MVIIINLFWDYISPFPWYLGPILQVIGLGCLWATRFTARFHPKWGDRYYLFSAIVRPIGIILISWAWIEMFSVKPDVPSPFRYCLPILPLSAGLICCFVVVNGFLRGFLGALALVIVGLTFVILFLSGGGSFAGWPIIGFPVIFLLLLWEFAAIFKLGLRRSFLYVRMDDPLITTGLYAHHRHPQLTAAVLLVFTAIGVMSKNYNEAILGLQAVNFLIFAVCIIFIVRGEELDLIIRFRYQYLDYRKSAPLFVRSGQEKPDKEFRFWRKLALVMVISVISYPLMISMTDTKGVLRATAESIYHIEDMEAKTNLGSIATANISYFAELENWGMTFDIIGWSPQGTSRNAYFLNSCDVVLPSSRNDLKGCPAALKEYFQRHPFSEKEGFHAASVYMPYASTSQKMKIWVIDQTKTPELLIETRDFDEFLPGNQKTRDLYRRRGQGIVE